MTGVVVYLGILWYPIKSKTIWGIVFSIILQGSTTKKNATHRAFQGVELPSDPPDRNL